MAKGDAAERKRRDQEIVDYIAAQASGGAAQEQGRRNRSVAVTVGREQYFNDQLREALQEVFSKRLAPLGTKLKKPTGKMSRILNLMISDTHYGANLDKREVGHRYGSVEEARRTAAICRQVADYKRQYRDETELYVHILGDLIQGQLHDMRDGLPLVEQVASAVRVLVQALRYLSHEFPRGVTVFCTPGNHGRNTARHRERATFQKFDSIEGMIYNSLKEVSDFIPNLTVRTSYEPKYDFQTFDTLGFGTHGDTVINPGNPGKNINVEGIEKQVNRINNARVIKNKQPYKLFIVGHVHVGSLTNLPGGVVVITNGCLIPPDSFCNSLGIFEGACGQWLWESVQGHQVGDSRFITVDEAHDADSSLDQIITPFTGL